MWTRQSLSQGCLMVQLKFDQLITDVVDHRAQTVNTHGKKFCCPFEMDLAVAGHHAQSLQPHGRIDQNDIGVAVLRTTIGVLRQTQFPQFLLGFLMIHACCMSCCDRIIMSIHTLNHTPLLFKGRGGVVHAKFILLHSILAGIQFCPFITILM